MLKNGFAAVLDNEDGTYGMSAVGSTPEEVLTSLEEVSVVSELRIVAIVPVNFYDNGQDLRKASDRQAALSLLVQARCC